jgi:hypothetical protein
MHSKIYEYKNAKTTYILKRREYKIKRTSTLPTIAGDKKTKTMI